MDILGAIRQALSGITGQKQPQKNQKIVSPLPASQTLVGRQIDKYIPKAQAAEVASLPGENDWVKTQTGSPFDESQLRQLYRKGVTAPGGHYYQAPQATPSQPIQQPSATPTPIRNPHVMPSGVDLALNYIRSNTPQGKQLEDYYPSTIGNPTFMQKVQAADKLRPGLANLLLLQAFQESTAGNKSTNTFGVLPPGGARFNTPIDALDYQLGPHVMGGGANPANMNILNSNSPLTSEDIRKFYLSYDPPGAYIGNILNLIDSYYK